MALGGSSCIPIGSPGTPGRPPMITNIFDEAGISASIAGLSSRNCNIVYNVISYAI